MSEPVVRRPNLPLTERDEVELARLRSSASLRKVLARLASGDSAVERMSEAMLLHAVFSAGLAAIRAAAEQEGYEALADDYREQARARRRLARRRPPDWIDEP